MSDGDWNETEHKVARFYQTEAVNDADKENKGPCICRWEYSGVMTEGPKHHDLFSGEPSRFAFQSTVFYREIKHYIDPNCVVHQALLRVVVQEVVERFKEQYPEAEKWARILAAADTHEDREDRGK
jgi:hypothetical protein